MRAAVLNTLGELPAMGIFAEPVAQEGEVIVSVLAASVKQLDRGIVKGTHYSSPKTLPIVPGTDGVGTLADGTRVYFSSFRPPFGALAERAVASWTVPVPDGVSDETAAALINPALAAWLPLAWRAKFQRGETVLIIGATGTSGKLAAAAARSLGAGRIVAAGRRQDVLNGLGADATVDLRLEGEALTRRFIEAAGAGGYDVIIDYIWGSATEALLAALTNHHLAPADNDSGYGVRLVNVGAMAAPSISLPAAVLRSSRLQILGSGTGNFPPVEQLTKIVADILALAARGDISVTTRTYPLSEISAAWNTPAEEDTRVVIRIG